MDNVSVLAAFGAGLLSFLSPCVLPMVPVYFASLYGPETEGIRKRGVLVGHSLFFVLGFSLVFTALGAIAGVSGYALDLSTTLLHRIAGGLLVAFGVFLLAALKIPWLNYEKRLAPALGVTGGYLRSLVIGAAFAAGWTACVSPILGGILMLAAVTATVWKGALLLLVYCLGLGLPFLVMGFAFDAVRPWLRRLQRYSRALQLVSGLLLVGIGVLVFTDSLYWFSALGS
ncbi:MAG: cytochrome c biogenesis protein CcdA [Chloroflexota bacterium]